jgi:hypothetical protein
MRVTEDQVCRPVLMWESGLYDQLARHLEHAVIGACRDEVTGRAGLLMTDLGEWFAPEGAVAFTPEQHEAFLNAMAAMHAGFWGWRDDVGLCPDGVRFSLFSHAAMEREALRGPLTGVPALVAPGWQTLRGLVPDAADPVAALVEDSTALAAAMAQTPRTLIHGDWKGGNLGLTQAGRVVLVDWAFPGESGGCSDLAWYLAVNCDRLPISKRASIAAYRDALERLGVPTQGWFERQLELGLLGAFCQLGWSKTQDPVELAWWVERITPVARELTR